MARCRWIASGDRDLYRHPGGDLLRGDDAFLESAQHWDPLAGSGSADDQNSFDLLIPVLVVVLTLYPLSLFIQHHLTC